MHALGIMGLIGRRERGKEFEPVAASGPLESFWGNLSCDLVPLRRREWNTGIAIAEERLAWYSIFQAPSPRSKHASPRDSPLH